MLEKQKAWIFGQIGPIDGRDENHAAKKRPSILNQYDDLDHSRKIRFKMLQLRYTNAMVSTAWQGR
jgi:hypothetical protein